MDAHPVTRYRGETARPTAMMEGEAGGHTSAVRKLQQLGDRDPPRLIAGALHKTDGITTVAAIKTNPKRGALGGRSLSSQ
jgi:hypothetical protein